MEDVDDYFAIPGSGIKARFNDTMIMVGSLEWLEKETCKINEDISVKIAELQKQDASILGITRDNELVGWISVVDKIRSSSVDAIKELHSLGLDTILLTGDKHTVATRIAAEIGIDKVLAEVLPADKSNHVRKLQDEGRKVGMVGDGINDAPALAQADIGFAIGTGSDIALEASDVTLIGSELAGVGYALRLSRQTVRIIKQNLFWAFGYNSLGIPIAAGILFPLTGMLLSPMIAAAAMAFSSVSVVMNSLRLSKFR